MQDTWTQCQIATSTLNVYIEIEDVKKSENVKQKSKKLIKRKKEYRRFKFNKQIEKING